MLLWLLLPPLCVRPAPLLLLLLLLLLLVFVVRWASLALGLLRAAGFANCETVAVPIDMGMGGDDDGTTFAAVLRPDAAGIGEDDAAIGDPVGTGEDKTAIFAVLIGGVAMVVTRTPTRPRHRTSHALLSGWSRVICTRDTSLRWRSLAHPGWP